VHGGAAGAVVEPGECAAIAAMVEKPAAEEAPSNMAIVGRYVLSRHTWSLLAKTLPGAGGEIQLTDALDKLLVDEAVEAYRLIGRSHDCGSKLGYMTANVHYAQRHPELGKAFSEFLQELKTESR
jgi:UTP--glucose-1-phosphate uridylyltransferase